MPDDELGEATPWEFRIALLLPIPPIATGVVIAGLLLAFYFASSWLVGLPFTEPDGGIAESTTDTIWLCLLVGYVFAALRVGSGGIEADLVDAGAQPSEGIGTFPLHLVRRSRYAGVVGVSLGFVVINVIAQLQGMAMEAPWTEIHQTSFFLWLFLGFFWLIGRAASFTLHGARYAVGLGAEDVEIDLLNLDPMRAYGRIGLRFALLWIVGFTLAAPMLLGPSLQLGGLLVAFTLVGVIATAALLIPVLGTRARVRDVKRAELAHVAAAIAGDEGAIAKTRIAAREGRLGLADLIAYRGLVESAPEWPYDAPTLARFVLYLLIPLASWVAAALVERGVDSVLTG